jgi:hypothetical protein
MNIQFYGIEFNLLEVTRVYPAVRIEFEEFGKIDYTEVSIEWAESKQDQITIKDYVLILDFDPVGEEIKNRQRIVFSTKGELLNSLQELNSLFQSLKK